MTQEKKDMTLSGHTYTIAYVHALMLLFLVYAYNGFYFYLLVALYISRTLYNLLLQFTVHHDA
jgi:hypothetical protein